MCICTWMFEFCQVCTCRYICVCVSMWVFVGCNWSHYRWGEIFSFPVSRKQDQTLMSNIVMLKLLVKCFYHVRREYWETGGGWIASLLNSILRSNNQWRRYIKNKPLQGHKQLHYISTKWSSLFKRHIYNWGYCPG